MTASRPLLPDLPFNKRLDFVATASMCGVMEENGSYDCAAVFARLTCVFEDAAGIASEGQATGLMTIQQKQHAAELGVLHQETGNILEELAGVLSR